MINFEKFAIFCEMINEDNLKISDADLIFIATYSAAKEKEGKRKMNPDRCLVRY